MDQWLQDNSTHLSAPPKEYLPECVSEVICSINSASNFSFQELQFLAAISFLHFCSPGTSKSRSVVSTTQSHGMFVNIFASL